MTRNHHFEKIFQGVKSSNGPQCSEQTLMPFAKVLHLDHTRGTNTSGDCSKTPSIGPPTMLKSMLLWCSKGAQVQIWRLCISQNCNTVHVRVYPERILASVHFCTVWVCKIRTAEGGRTGLRKVTLIRPLGCASIRPSRPLTYPQRHHTPRHTRITHPGTHPQTHSHSSPRHRCTATPIHTPRHTPAHTHFCPANSTVRTPWQACIAGGPHAVVRGKFYASVLRMTCGFWGMSSKSRTCIYASISTSLPCPHTHGRLPLTDGAER